MRVERRPAKPGIADSRFGPLLKNAVAFEGDHLSSAFFFGMPETPFSGVCAPPARRATFFRSLLKAVTSLTSLFSECARDAVHANVHSLTNTILTYMANYPHRRRTGNRNRLRFPMPVSGGKPRYSLVFVLLFA